jgi:chemotaxis protein CheX
MTNSEVAVRAVVQKKLGRPPGDISAVLELRSATEGFLVLSYPRQMAATLAGRVLADVAGELDELLIRDCVGEIANVVAGQAKALLAGTPYQFTFSIPTVMTGEEAASRPPHGRECLCVAFSSDVGEFALSITLPAD